MIDDKLRALLDAIPAVIWLAGPDGKAIYIGQRWLKYTGLPHGPALEGSWASAVHPDDRERVAEYWRGLIARRVAGTIESRLRRYDGTYRWFQVNAEPLFDDAGKVTAWCGSSIDIDDRKRAEERLQSGGRYRAMVDNIPAMVVIYSDTGVQELQNQTALAFHGYIVEEMDEWQDTPVMHPDDVADFVNAWQRSTSTGEPLEIEMRMRRADGAYRWVRLRSIRAKDDDDGEYHWFGVGVDVHDRRTAEDDLKRSEARLLAVQRLSRTGAWRFDPAAGTLESSPEILRAHDVQPGEDPSRPQFWFDRIHPEDRPRVHAQFTRCLEERTDYRAGYRIVLPDGSIKYQYATGHPVVNDAGDLVEVVGASMDMTEHWLATTELDRASEAIRDLQIRMSRAAQVATVGELAASIAHEVNQPLAAVVANGHACLRWLAASPPNVPKALEAAERLVKDGKDAGEVIRRVRALFKKTTLEKVALDVNEVIAEVLRVLDSHPTRQQIAVETTLDPALPPLLADRVQLQQLVLNLMLNALEALESVANRTKQVSVCTKRGECDAVLIQVADNGVGIDNPHTAFEPFVTTKANGMGLGLAICKSIVSAHDGKLSAERNVGFGTTFTIALPT
ncbi:MAG TPA: PAS domain-containing protein [Polyangiaceae bacterium]